MYSDKSFSILSVSVLLSLSLPVCLSGNCFCCVLKTAADAIYQRHRDSVIYSVTDNVIEYSALRASCSDICSDEQSFQVAVLELIRQKLCTVTTSSDGERVSKRSQLTNESIHKACLVK